MKVSLNWIRKLTDVSVGLNQLIDVVGSQLGAIDGVEDLGAKYKDVMIVRVVSVSKHPQADRLQVCLIDDGNLTHNIPRNDHGLIQVVCGAPNVRAEMLAVWLPPGSTIPETYGTKEPVTLGIRPMRGIPSNGMLASQRELALGDEHRGIMEVDEPSKPGEPFADVYELNDFIIDIENKMFTHRPDLFGMVGIAREIAGITNIQFKSPKWYTHLADNPITQEARPLPLVVSNEATDLVQRFMAVVIQDVTMRYSPLLFQSYLLRIGIRPINNVVDVTNYMMALTGQPMHAYDYDKLRELDNADNGQVSLVVRRPEGPEPAVLLNGKLIHARPDDILVSTATQVVGLGGVMGGLLAEIDSHTRTIVLECATFDMYAVRRTAMAHGLHTDAVTRFTKGQSPLQNEHVLVKAVNVLKGMAGGQVASMVFDDRHLDGVVATSESVHQPVKIAIDFINDRLGSELNEETIVEMLKHVEFDVQSVTDGVLMVSAPFWRTDIEQAEDIVEEVGRLYGFDRLPISLPTRDSHPVTQNAQLVLRDEVRRMLATAGMNEVLGYSFVNAKTIRQAGQDASMAYELSNALSPALQHYRLSLTPSLLEKVYANIKAGYGRFGLFELGKAHNKSQHDNEGLPKATEHIATVIAADVKTARAMYQGAAFYQAKESLDRLLRNFHLVSKVTFEPVPEQESTSAPGDDGSITISRPADEQAVWLAQLCAPYEPARSLLVKGDDGRVWGIVGEFRASVRRDFKLPDFTAGFELDQTLLRHGTVLPHYVPLPRYPGIKQDITLKVSAQTGYKTVHDYLVDYFVKHRPKHATTDIEPVDIYQSPDDVTHKHLSFRMSITNTERTMTDKEVAILVGKAAESIKADLSAERV